VTEPAYRGTHVQLEVFSLGANDARHLNTPADEESVLVLLRGDIELDGETFIGSRSSVFEARATAVYLPPGADTFTLDGLRDAELALITTVGCNLSIEDTRPVFVYPNDVVVHQRGKPGWQRDVHDVVADNVPSARRLIVGETFNHEGQWSSFPPHKHDGADGEPALEEVYYYRFDRPDGFGFQGLYEANGDERAVFLRHGSIVGIPHGYHPVCAAPGYRLDYLWALVGAQRALAMYEDPAHRWLNSERGDR